MTLGSLTGIAAGTQSRPIVTLPGLVMVAVESLFMAAGSYLSAKSQGSISNACYTRKKRRSSRIRRVNGGKSGRCMACGYTEDEMAIIEKRFFNDENLLLEDMAHKELGICPQSWDEPLGNAVAMGWPTSSAA